MSLHFGYKKNVSLVITAVYFFLVVYRIKILERPFFCVIYQQFAFCDRSHKSLNVSMKRTKCNFELDPSAFFIYFFVIS